MTPAFVGGSGKTFKSYETHYVNQTVSVGGELQLDVGHWTLDAANLSASDISGQCGQLKIISRQDERDAGSTNFSVCSNGEVGFSQASVKSRHTKQASGITILRKGDARETPLKLHVSKAELEGGTIVNNSDNTRVHIDAISARTIEDSEHSTCTGISTNVHSLIGDSKQTPKLETQLHIHKRDQIGTIGALNKGDYCYNHPYYFSAKSVFIK